jgi:hypothetical protein
MGSSRDFDRRPVPLDFECATSRRQIALEALFHDLHPSAVPT